MRSVFFLLLTAVASTTSDAACAHEPFMGAYVNIPKLFDSDSDIADRVRAIEVHLDRFKASGLNVVMPYVTTTVGTALYPSEIVPDRLYPDWEPLRVVMRAAQARGLQVYPVTCVLACGKERPQGILLQHTEWALRDEAGSPIGHISPCHPQARAWVVSVMHEIVEKYEPDGLLLDYLRFNNRPMQLDPHGATQLQKLTRGISASLKPQRLQRFKEDNLTRLMQSISIDLRRQQPGIKLAIYSWGPHVVQNHRVAQDWRTWAQKRYIDMVNISGYCFPKNYGDRYMQVFADRIGGALEINRRLRRPIYVTLCLGIKTSHGQIDNATDVNNYLATAGRLGVDGAAVFTWAHAEPYLDNIVQAGYLTNFTDSLRNRR
ncbi:MAG: family 10 glycosylhydrolase [Fuerstiella sp.]|nr:family 10 glycosylhydrolase [Fuerstiella sp.]